MSSKLKCPNCQGTGKIITKNQLKCPKCRGMGSTKIIIGSKPTDKDKCSECSGSGSITNEKVKNCPDCGGTGIQETKCIICGKSTKKNEDLCLDCSTKNIIYQLISPATINTIEFNRIYKAQVVSIVDFGYFVKLAEKVEGLIRNKNFRGSEGDIQYVKLINKKGGKLEFQSIDIINPSEFRVKRSHDPVAFQKINSKRDIGTFITIQAKVENIRQIPKGPKIFTLADETGIIEAAGFRLDYIESINIGDIVEVIGEFSSHRGVEQIELADIFVVEDAYANAFKNRMEIFIDQKSQPPDIDFLVVSDIYSTLKPKFLQVAKRIRRALIELQPIIIRHHNDCDGISAGISLEESMREFWVELYGDLDEEKTRHIIKRTVNKPPFYDPLDVVRDLNFALEDQQRFGDKLPLVIMLDTGSSNESLFSYKLLKTYGIEILVVDHHFPTPSIQEIIDAHLNVYYAGGDYNICTGMLGVELARFVNVGITDRIKHIAAIAGKGDRVEGKEMDQYMKFALDRGYSDEFLHDIAIAVDYQAYFLKFSPGRLLLCDLLGLSTNTQDKQLKFVNLLATEAKKLLESQLQISLEYVQQERLRNGIQLSVLDVEKYTSRFDYPPPGKITGSLFDHLAKTNDNKPLVVIGLGPDFAIFRSQNVKLDFPNLVKECEKRVPFAAVEGGGHEIVGSMKFITGALNDVLVVIKELLANIEI
ncbi:MAG: hypothetical protein EAX86_03105 [Candidatus Heimdallarchaeota archaeon]|nr:hypothetical protein [Candidatus Heimdallarchaeota archaeon]